MVWKILFIIYVLIMLGLGFAGLGVENTFKVSPSEALVNTCVEVVLVFAMIYTFALGWKKRLISEKVHKWFFYFSILSFVVVGVFLYMHVYAPMYADMILEAMKNGMVPRNWDFQMLLTMTRVEVLIFVLLALFLIYVPFYLGYYHYSKTMNLLGFAKNSGRKCFAVYAIASYAFIYLAMFFGVAGDIMNFNIFDCFSTLSSLYIVLGLYGYAFNQEILNQTFWRITLPVCIVIELLPASFFSADFKSAVGMGITETSPIYVISSFVMTAVAIYMLYMYASTDVVFKNTDADESI